MILNRIHTPRDLRELPVNDLSRLCDELRSFVRNSTEEKEGHIRSSLGVTELTVALHYSLNTPQDILIWDVGHQAYIHKILTDRKERFTTNRKKGGISGFTNRAESVYDPFGAGHSSTSISAAAGFALADRLRNSAERKIVAVIGDGSVTAGMSFEALNYLGESKLDVLIILNDNKSSIDDNRGALAQLDSYPDYCKSLGIDYLGECDGHKIDSLVPELRSAINRKGPRLLKVNTRKAKGRRAVKTKTHSKPTFQEVFSHSLIDIARRNNKLVVISPAMLSGGNLTEFAKLFPDRCVDVGIAEQHAVTLVAGLAADGMIPVVHLYSTFAQRAYDQIIHDVALQNLPVILAIDRAGLVGSDGSTHHGVFDPGFFNTVPNLKVCSPINSLVLTKHLKDAVEGDTPVVLRFPKEHLVAQLERSTISPIGQGVYSLKQGSGIALLSFGIIAGEAEKAVGDFDVSHYNISCLKPFPSKVIRDIARQHDMIISVEENSARGGLGDSIAAALRGSGIPCELVSRSLPDRFIEHASREELLQDNGLDSKSIKNLLVSLHSH